MRRTFAMRGIVVLLAMLLVVPSPTAAQDGPTPGSAGSDEDAILFEDVRPGERGGVVAETADRVSRYRIDATLEFGPAGSDASGSPGATITGTEEVRVSNTTGQPLTEVVLRLFANGPPLFPEPGTAAAGRLEVRDVTVDGRGATPRMSVGDSVLRIPLPAPLPRGGSTTLALEFSTTVPTAADGSPLLAFEPATTTWVLAHWYPILAGYDAETGWADDPFNQWGDPVFAEAALYDVSVTARRDLVLATSGRRLASERQGDRTRHRFVAGPVRGFSMVADDDFASASREVDGTTVTSHFNPGHEAAGDLVLRAAARALALYNELFGAYPYEELDLVEAPLSRFGGGAGVELPELILMGGAFYPSDGRAGASPAVVEAVVAHEVAHQWWYGLVGNNQNRHAFIDEGLAEDSTGLYLERASGDAAAQRYRDGFSRSYAAMVSTVGDQIVDQPTDAFPGPGAYFPSVYSKAALGFGAVRAEIGDDAFVAGLRDYVARFRFAVATPDDLRAAFERAAGRDLKELWRSRFEAAAGTPAPG